MMRCALQRTFDPATGIQAFKVGWISKASADQVRRCVGCSAGTARACVERASYLNASGRREC